MKATTKLALAAAFAATAFAGTASAEGTVIHTRSPEAAHADLVRDWSFNGGGNAGEVRQRTSAEMRADLVRDWNAKPAAEDRSQVYSRNEQQAHDDLMRNWN